MIDTILLIIFGGVMTLFLLAGLLIHALVMERRFGNAEGDRTNIESRLHWSKLRQYEHKKLLKAILRLLKTLHKK